MSDLIKRADAIEALEGNKSDWNNDYNRPIEKDIQAIKALPSAEAEGSLKAIRRQIDEHWYLDPPSAEATCETCADRAMCIMSAPDGKWKACKDYRPSAEAVQGEWIEVEVFPEVYDIEGVKTWGSEMQCDQCGFRHTAIEGHMAQYNFCPNCGARMLNGGEQDGNV